MKKSKGRIVFEVINVIVLSLLSFACLFPLLNILAMSFSSSTAVAAGKVSIFPVEFNLYAYDYVVGKADFWKSLLRSVERVAIGLPLNMILTIMLAYPLSKESTSFRMRTVYVWIFFFTMLFSGGLIPGYLLIQNLKMMDTIWALVLPAAVPVYNVILMLNFFRGIPHELEEAAEIDGAGQWRICFQIFVPCAKPSIATLMLFSFISHWNSWFDGLIYSNFPSSYPLASFLQTVVVQRDMTLLSLEDWQSMSMISDRTVRCAQIFVGIIPIILIYPFAQKYFVKGMTVGSVKGINENPVFSWQLVSDKKDEKNERQTAYRILVSESEASLINETGMLWDSGVVKESRCFGILYQGKKLHSAQKAYWKVMVWDGENQASVWSETASFETGLLEREDWKGTWIGQGEDYENQELAPVLVGEFEVADLEQVVCARAYISGLGVFLADMNGQKLSDAFFEPGESDATKTVYYVTYFRH